MFGFASGLLRGAVSPLLAQLSAASARILRKLALFLVAAICMVVVLIALTIAFDLWIASLAGPIVGALAVAAVYLLIAVLAVILATSERRPTSPSDAAQEPASDPYGTEEQIDEFTTPLMRILGGLGLRREQIAVLAGGSLAKQIGPIPLVGLAILAGFLIGRSWKIWRDLITFDALAALLSSLGLFAPDIGQPQAADETDGA